MIIIVCDDSKTAVAYFTELKTLYKNRVTLQVEHSPFHGAMPDDVLECAELHQEALFSENAKDHNDQSEVWALIDLEHEPKRQSLAHSAKKRGENSGIRVALSKPCYEVWTLLHLVDTGGLFDDCSAVLARIQLEWQKQFSQPFGTKAQADYPKVIPRLDDAVDRARKRCETNPRDPSWTEVYLVVEAIKKYL